MREIKFRAWDKYTERMVKVNRIDFDEKEIDVVINKTKCTEDYESMSFDEIELMQYTGLKDKNGKEIYEGDIVHYKNEIEQLGHFLIHEQVGEIKIDKGMTGFKGKTKQIFKDEINIHDSKFLFLSSDIYEVIGNIYENPELMEMKGSEENISTKTRV